MLIIKSGAWSYTVWHLDGIPYWLPVAYGLMALISLNLYRRLEEKKK